MRVSPFTPLFFISHKTDGIASDYIQTFSTTDQILLEIIGQPQENVSARILKEPSGVVLCEINFNGWAINDSTHLWFTTISLSPGLYSVEVDGVGRCQVFNVTDCPYELERTTLIQYSMRDNRQRDDAVFYIDRMRYFFDFRVPGGFKDSGVSFGVDGEQFVTDHSDIVQLYALDSVQRKFTLGSSGGCQAWFAELLNRVLCCTYVYFDGVRYARKDTSVPELSVQLEGVNSFVFTQNLQQVRITDPVLEQSNQAIIRRVDDVDYRSVSTTINRLLI